jgi:N-acetylmuramoyl-L-alanine amidase
VLRLVPEADRAWHAGAGAWGGAGDVNSRSIGIEIDNDGLSPFAAPAMASLEALLPGILSRWSIPPEGVIAHSDMAPGRKADPGARFDWQRLARQGLAIWPEAQAGVDPDPARFAADLTRFGYPEAPPESRLAAFRLRFRPGQTGPLDARDMGRAADLARRFPIDPAAPTA